MMRGEEHKQPQNKQKPTKQEPKNTTKRPEAESPHLKVFPLYEGETGETGERSWLETNYGPEFTTKVGR